MAGETGQPHPRMETTTADTDYHVAADLVRKVLEHWQPQYALLERRVRTLHWWHRSRTLYWRVRTRAPDWFSTGQIEIQREVLC